MEQLAARCSAELLNVLKIRTKLAPTSQLSKLDPAHSRTSRTSRQHQTKSDAKSALVTLRVAVTVTQLDSHTSHSSRVQKCTAIKI